MSGPVSVVRDILCCYSNSNREGRVPENTICALERRYQHCQIISVGLHYLDPFRSKHLTRGLRNISRDIPDSIVDFSEEGYYNQRALKVSFQ